MALVDDWSGPLILLLPRHGVESVGEGLDDSASSGWSQGDFATYTYDREFGVWRLLLREADFERSERDGDAKPVKEDAGHLVGIDVRAGTVANNLWQSLLRLFHR